MYHSGLLAPARHPKCIRCRRARCIFWTHSSPRDIRMHLPDPRAMRPSDSLANGVTSEMHPRPPHDASSDSLSAPEHPNPSARWCILRTRLPTARHPKCTRTLYLPDSLANPRDIGMYPQPPRGAPLDSLATAWHPKCIRNRRAISLWRYVKKKSKKKKFRRESHVVFDFMFACPFVRM